MRYKVGDKVVIKEGLKFNGNDYSNNITVIIGIREYEGHIGLEDYEVGIHRNLCLYDRDINHEATAKLNEVKPVDLLETGMIVEFENKEVMIVLKGNLKTFWAGTQNLSFINNKDYLTGKSYSTDLKNKLNSDYNINKIYKRMINSLTNMIQLDEDCELIWERKPEPKQPKVITYTTQELMDKLGLDGDTEIKIVDRK